MWLIVGFMVHVALIYFGAQFAQLHCADFWRCTGAGCLSFIGMLLLGGFVAPLALFGTPALSVPYGAHVVNAVALLAATALAVRLLLSASWVQAWTIGALVSVANLLWSVLTISPLPLCRPGG
jgi:hypothetical protein